MLIYNFFFFKFLGAKITKILGGSGRSRKVGVEGGKRRKEKKVFLDVKGSLAWAVASYWRLVLLGLLWSLSLLSLLSLCLSPLSLPLPLLSLRDLLLGLLVLLLLWLQGKDP